MQKQSPSSLMMERLLFLLLIAALYALIVLYITEVWRKLYKVADKTTEHNKLTKYEYTNKLS